MTRSASRTFCLGSSILLALIAAPGPSGAQSLPAPTRLIDPDFGLFEAYGLSASGSGDTLVIGAPGASPDPLVDVYLRSGSTWNQQARVTSPDGGANDFFGDAVAQDGDRLVVGAPDRLGASGAAYVFVRTGASWSLEATLRANDPAGNARFGDAVAIDGDTVAIGAIGFNQSRGAVYVFTRTGSIWSQQQRLSLPSGAANDRLGLSVALSGGALIAGSPGRDGVAVDQGGAFLWRRSGSNWTQEASFVRAVPAGGDRLGWSVDIDGDIAVAGAPGAESMGPSNTGLVLSWVRTGSSWQALSELGSPDLSEGAQFGSAVLLSGPRLLVGAPDDDVEGANLRGSAALFLFDDEQWLPRQRLLAPAGATEDQFGSALAFGGNIAGVTAPGTVVDGQPLAGAAYAYVSLATRTTLDSIPVPVLIGSTYSASVSVSADEGIAGGEVLLRDNNGNTCTAVLMAGSGSCTLTASAVGPRSLRARYNGAPGFAESFGEASVQVKPDLRLQPASLPEGQIGAAYSLLFDTAATGATLPLTFSVASGQLPQGLSLGSNGLLSGTPSEFGNFSFSVRVIDSSSAALGGPFSESRSYSLLIQPPFRTTLALDTIASPRDRGVTVAFGAQLDVIETGAGAPSGTFAVSAANGTSTLSCSTPVVAEGPQSCSIEFGPGVAVGDYVVSAAFTSTNADFGSSSDSDGLRLLSASDPLLGLSALDPLYQAGDSLRFRVDVQNPGPDVAFALRIQAPAPVGLQNISWTCSGAACPAPGGSGAPDLQIAALAAGASLQIDLTGSLAAPPPLQITASAGLSLEASGFSRDRDLGNNSASAQSLPLKLFANGFETPED
jgi:hypothetical protein